MIRGFFFERDNNISSVIHLIDPRVKIISLFLLMIIIAITSPLSHYKFLVYFLMIVLMICFSRIRLKNLARRLLLLVPLLMFLTFSVLIFGKRPFSEDVVILWNLFVKSALIFLCLAVLSSTTKFYHLAKGLEQLKVPQIVTSLLSFAYRYSFLFAKEAERLKRALESRNFTRRSKREQWKVMSHVVPHIFLKTLERSERIYMAMLSRGFERKIQTFTLFKVGKNDYIFFFLFLFLLVFSMVIL